MPDIRGSERLIAQLGYWPTFHDAEVVRFSILRTRDYATGPDVEADIYVFHITGVVGANGAYIRDRETLLTLRFYGVANLKLFDADNCNALLGLRVSDIRSHQLERLNHEVAFDGSMGLSASFLCRDVEVLAARPWNSDSDGFFVEPTCADGR